jgi:hypothetical protein
MDELESFEMLRSERRSFFCPNKLWKELKKKTDDCISVSTFIKQAIIEKLIREEPEKKDYFESLLFASFDKI